MELLAQYLPNTESPGPGSFAGEFYPTFTGLTTPHAPLKHREPFLIYSEPSRALICKSARHHRERKVQAHSLCRCRRPQQNPRKPASTEKGAGTTAARGPPTDRMFVPPGPCTEPPSPGAQSRGGLVLGRRSGHEGRAYEGLMSL